MELTILCTCLSLYLTPICKTPDAPLHFARLSGNILKVCGKYYMHLSGNLVSFLTVEFLYIGP